MLELICFSLLGAAYIKASIDEYKEAKNEEEKKRINEIKIKVFCYAIRHKLLYNQVVKMIQNNQITLEDIENENK